MTLCRISPRRVKPQGKAIDPVFAARLRQEGVPLPEMEHKFHPDRKWRMDFAWPHSKVFLEVEGGVWTAGHTRPSIFLKNVEKYNAAAVMGWRLLRCQPKELCRTETINMIREAIQTITAA